MGYKLIKPFKIGATQFNIYQYKYSKNPRILKKQLDNEKYLLKVIEAFSKKQRIAHKFLEYNFVLDGTKAEGFFSVGIASVEDNDPHTDTRCYVHITNNSNSNVRQYSIGNFIGTIKHELTHVLQMVTKPRQRKARKKAIKKLEKLALDKYQYAQGNELYYLRYKLANFFYKLSFEGVAEFAGYKVNWDERTLHRFYERAKKLIIKIRNTIANVIWKSSEFWERKHSNYAYDIGAHMAYTILYANEGRLGIIDLVKMGPFKFTRTYEKACLLLGLRPVVSSGGEGIFDYKYEIQDLKERYDKYYKK